LIFFVLKLLCHCIVEPEDEYICLGQGSLIIDDNECLRLAPAEGRTPLSLITDKDSDYLAFPQILCGERMLEEPEIQKISYTSFIKPVAR
jgi:hypothetical protein